MSLKTESRSGVRSPKKRYRSRGGITSLSDTLSSEEVNLCSRHTGYPVVLRKPDVLLPYSLK